MARIGWNALAPIAPNEQFAQMANTSFNNGINTLAGAVRGFATDTRNQNTENILREAMAINDMNDLAEGRRGVLESIQQYGTGADSLRALEALNNQEKAVYAKQQTLNQLAKADRELVREQGLDADRVRMNNPSLLRKLASGNVDALNQAGQFYDSSNMFNAYVAGNKQRLDGERYAQDRSDRLTQQGFANALAREEHDLRLATTLNPNAGQQYSTFEDDGYGGTTEEIRIMPTTAQTLAAISASRGKNGQIDWGSVTGATAGQPAQASGPIASAAGGRSGSGIRGTVSSNLSSLAKNIGGGSELGRVINKLDIRDPNVLAMIAIESGGGGMGTNSGSSVGPMQLNTKYAQAEARRLGISGDPLTSMEANVQTGIAKMNELSSMFNGNKDAIAIGYNGGNAAAQTAYNAWLKAGQRGRVMDYVPSTYTSKGKTYNYDVKQMKDHALKFEDASARLASNMGGGKAAPAKQAAQPSRFNLGNGALAVAQQGFKGGMRGNELAFNSANRVENAKDTNALQMYLDDNKISTGGGGFYSSDAQNVFDVLNKNSEFNKRSASEKKTILDNVITYNNNNQGWFGRNPHEDQINHRANMLMQNMVGNKSSQHSEKQFSLLRDEAEKAIAAEAKRKGRSGPLPTMDQMMRLISPEVYNSMKEKDKATNNPF